MAGKTQHTEAEAAGEHKERAAGSQGCNAVSSTTQVKALHEARLGQASAVTRQVGTLLREGALRQTGLE